MSKFCHCHCGFRSHLKSLKAGKLGFLGALLFGLHFLFHVVECLVLPAVLVGLGGHFTEAPAVALEQTQTAPALAPLPSFASRTPTLPCPALSETLLAAPSSSPAS